MKGEKTLYVSKGALVIHWLMFTFWLLGAYPFLVQLKSFDLFQTVDGYVVTFFEGAYMAIGLLLLRNKWDKAVVLGFMAMSLIDTVFINGLPAKEWINGLRFYGPMVFMLPVMRYVFATEARRAYFIELMDRSLYIFLWLQGPCMIYQLLVFGGWDYGGGSLGFFQSGVVSELIYTVSFYLMARRWDRTKNYFVNLYKNWILIFLLYPSFLNETKASLFFIVMYFLFLVPINKKFVKSMLITLPLLIGTLWLFNYIYMSIYGTKTDTGAILTVEYFDYYVLGDESSFDLMEVAYENSDVDEDQDFQRGLKWAALPWLMDDHGAQSWIWGNGTGIDKGHSVDSPSEFGQSYRWLLQGTMMTLEMLILECGILGVVWFIFAVSVLFSTGSKKRGMARQIVIFLVSMLLFVIVYNTSMNLFFFCLVYYYMVFVAGYWKDAEEMGNIRSEGNMIGLGGVFKKVRLSGGRYGNGIEDQ